jgi:hypothetical protein
MYLGMEGINNPVTIFLQCWVQSELLYNTSPCCSVLETSYIFISVWFKPHSLNNDKYILNDCSILTRASFSWAC